jgi:hypothetical protein
MVKDLKNTDIYAQIFAPQYDNVNDIQYSKVDLVFDSHILSDYHLNAESLY